MDATSCARRSRQRRAGWGTGLSATGLVLVVLLVFGILACAKRAGLPSYSNAAAIAHDLEAAQLGCSDLEATPADEQDRNEIGMTEKGVCHLEGGYPIDFLLFDTDAHRREELALDAWYGCGMSEDHPEQYMYVHGDGWVVSHFLVSMAPVSGFPAAEIAKATGGEAHTIDCSAASSYANELQTVATDEAAKQRLTDQLLGENG